MAIMNAIGNVKHLLVFGLLAGLLTLLLVPVNFSHYNSRILDASWDLGHLVAFMGLVYGVYYYVPRFKTVTLSRQYLFMLLFAALLGLLFEGIQTLTGRMASRHDIFLDMVGGVIAVTLFSCSVVKLKYRLAIWCLVMLLFLVSTKTLLTYLWDERVIKQQFPLLGGFEREIEKSRWFGTAELLINREHASKGRQSLKVKFNPGRYSGVKLSALFADWQGYEYFAMDIYFPNTEPLTITLSIYSVQNTHTATNYNFRFNQIIKLQHGWNKIIFPLKEVRRSLPDGINSISNIAGLMLYVMNEPDPQVIYLDNIRLIKDSSAF